MSQKANYHGTDAWKKHVEEQESKERNCSPHLPSNTCLGFKNTKIEGIALTDEKGRITHIVRTDKPWLEK